MAADPTDLDVLLAQFGKLGRRDRQAILAQLAPESRERVETALTAQADARHAEAERVRRAGRQFAGYSPWLSDLLQAVSANGDANAAPLSDATGRAAIDIHQALQGEERGEEVSLLSRLRGWTAALMAPRPGGQP